MDVSVAVEVLQELPAQEEVGLAAAGCCWKTTEMGCGIVSVIVVTTCHSCTETN